MNLEVRKIAFIQEFLRLQNEETISELEKLLHKSKSELPEGELRPMSLEEFNQEIDKALDDGTDAGIISSEESKEKSKHENNDLDPKF